MPSMPEQRRHLALVHDAVARERRVLLVERQRAAGEPLVLQRLAHEAGRAHGQAVVGEGGRAGVRQLGHLGQPLSGLADRDRRGESSWDPRLGARALAKRSQHRRGVHHRVGVRHGEDGAVAAGRGGAGAGLDVLLVLAARGAQVNVRVDEGREGVQALRVHELGARRAARARRARPARRSRRRAPAGRPGRRCPRAGRAGARRESAQSRAARRRGRGRCSVRPLMRAAAPWARRRRGLPAA